jgi:hypothetical protein
MCEDMLNCGDEARLAPPPARPRVSRLQEKQPQIDGRGERCAVFIVSLDIKRQQ